MAEIQDFERAWLSKLSNRLDIIAGEEIRRKVMEGSEALSAHSSPQEVIDWTKAAMNRTDSLIDQEKRRELMTGCACNYPKAELQRIRQEYKVTGDLDLAHQRLQGQFEALLRNSLGLDDTLAEVIIERGWGLAGIKEGSKIIATKIPKSGNLIEYMRETDPEIKRQYYCHCPRVRDILKTSETISLTYCYCGAGYYKGIWEEILQKPVKVEVLQTVLNGDEVCRFAIYLPSDA
ncbi:MAG: hypothetical protein JSV77_06645 [Dehalococcoidales bacterium]|nr:MAG: hypothetical protein JSV77_06645 [Dehalococcoidales bacterium]